MGSCQSGPRGGGMCAGACVLWCDRKRPLCWCCRPGVWSLGPLSGDAEPDRNYCAGGMEQGWASGHMGTAVSPCPGRSLPRTKPSSPGLQDRLGEESAHLGTQGKRQSWRSPPPPTSGTSYPPVDVPTFPLWTPSPFPWVSVREDTFLCRGQACPPPPHLGDCFSE